MKKRIGLLILWLFVLGCGFWALDRGMRRDDSARKYDGFFAEKNDFDVLFLGTSRVLDGVQPMELWRDYGITSYNMGNNSEPLGMTYHVLDLAIRTHKPKVAVVDVFYMTHRLEERWTYAYRHVFLDHVPMSRAKVNTVRTVFPKEDWLEFLMPFSLYHSRWDEILSGQTERMVNCERFMMGSELRRGCMTKEMIFTEEATDPENLPGTQAIRDMAKLCREQGIELVLMALSGFASETEQQAMNAVYEIAEELEVPFVNMLNSGVVDYATDCNDEMGHLNPSGANKATAYLGAWLTAYDTSLQDKRGMAGMEHWDSNLKQYEAYRAENWSDTPAVELDK